MAIRTCKNGHKYDDSIYGENCPCCTGAAPMGGGYSDGRTQIGGAAGMAMGGAMGGGYGQPAPTVQVGGGYGQPAGGFGGGFNDGRTQVGGGFGQPVPGPFNDGKTQIGGAAGGGNDDKTNVRTSLGTPSQIGRANPEATQIRRPATGGEEKGFGGRKVVALLVTYTHDPHGKVYNIYEGNTTIGKDQRNDIAITADAAISKEHLKILYREAEGKFWCIDQNSSNGTFINDSFAGDKTELANGDVIRIGDTRLVFLIIPKF